MIWRKPGSAWLSTSRRLGDGIFGGSGLHPLEGAWAAAVARHSAYGEELPAPIADLKRFL
ncbi:hypothetical protein C7T86_19415 [Xanthomonas citri pv. malvacearum]|uniref:Uncharacterized protein n=1 Tax=Xanthomonas campestris pv. malvacearum TaxID=86040 RepID=A0AA44YY37_XANCM|nr:hypothetical protein C7T86_19415 [Xanthomonas citri pv. malvacearum]